MAGTEFLYRRSKPPRNPSAGAASKSLYWVPCFRDSTCRPHGAVPAVSEYSIVAVAERRVETPRLPTMRRPRRDEFALRPPFLFARLSYFRPPPNNSLISARYQPTAMANRHFVYKKQMWTNSTSFLAGNSGFDPRLLEKCALKLEEGSSGKEVVDFKWSAAMNREKERRNKIITLSLLFGTQFFSFMIRVAFGVVAPTLMTLYHLSPKTMGYILSGWNWSYTAGLLLVGFIVDRFGPYIVLGIGSLVWGASTIALPLSTAALPLFLMRMIFGLGQTPLIPAGASVVARGFSVQERARIIAIAFAGNQVGIALGTIIAAFILVTLGWQAVFYCIGGASLLLTMAWLRLYPDKRIKRQPPALPTPAHKDARQRIPWLALFRYRSTWGIAFGQMGYLYAYFFFVSWLPGYLVLERKMTVLQSGIVSALPFWAGLLGTLSGGWLGDYLTKRGVSTAASRKSIIAVSLSLSTVLVITEIGREYV